MLSVLLLRDEAGFTNNEFPNPTSSTSGDVAEDTPVLRRRELGVVGVVGVVEPELEGVVFSDVVFEGSKVNCSIEAIVSVLDFRAEVGVVLDGATLEPVGVALLSEEASLFLGFGDEEEKEVREERPFPEGTGPKDFRATTGDDIGDGLFAGELNFLSEVGVVLGDFNDPRELLSNDRRLKVGVVLRVVKGDDGAPPPRNDLSNFGLEATGDREGLGTGLRLATRGEVGGVSIIVLALTELGLLLGVCLGLSFPPNDGLRSGLREVVKRLNCCCSFE